jgi:hypothetical protein
MATILAAATGNFNSTGTWTGGVVPVGGDIAVANGKTVTITANIGSSGNPIELRNDTTGGATTGGSFPVNGGLTIYVTLTLTSATALVTAGTGASTGTVSIIGDISSTGSGNAISWSITSGTLNVTCPTGITFGNNTQAAIFLQGNAVGSSPATFNITTPAMTVTGSTQGVGVRQNNGGVINASGPSGTAINLTSPTQNPPNTTCGNFFYTLSSGAATLNITANMPYNAYGTATALQVAGTGATVNWTGDIYGGGAGANAGNLILASAGTLNIYGTVTATPLSVSPAIVMSGAGATVTVNKIKAGLNCPAVAGTAGTFKCYAAEAGDSGYAAAHYPVIFLDRSASSGTGSTANTYVMFRGSTTKRTLVDPSTAYSFMPAVTDVRSGTSYNTSGSAYNSTGTLTGTCVIPAASSVSSGTAVDATVGSAALTPAIFYAYLTSNSLTGGSFGERFANAATTNTTGQQIADSLTG